MSTELTTQNAGVPAYLETHKADNNDGITRDAIKIPFIKKVERLSKECKDGIAEFGDIINSVTKENLGSPIQIIPVKYYRDFKEFDRAGQLVDTSRDCITWANSGKKVDKNDLKDADGKITVKGDWQHEFHNFYVLVPGNPLPFILSFGHSSNKEGLNLVNYSYQLSKIKEQAIYTRIYTLSVTKKEQDNNEFLVWNVVPPKKDEYTPEDVCKIAAQMQISIEKYQPAEEAKPEKDKAPEDVAEKFSGKII